MSPSLYSCLRKLRSNNVVIAFSQATYKGVTIHMINNAYLGGDNSHSVEIHTGQVAIDKRRKTIAHSRRIHEKGVNRYTPINAGCLHDLRWKSDQFTSTHAQHSSLNLNNLFGIKPAGFSRIAPLI